MQCCVEWHWGISCVMKLKHRSEHCRTSDLHQVRLPDEGLETESVNSVRKYFLFQFAGHWFSPTYLCCAYFVIKLTLSLSSLGDPVSQWLLPFCQRWLWCQNFPRSSDKAKTKRSLPCQLRVSKVLKAACYSVQEFDNLISPNSSKAHCFSYQQK